MTHPTEARIREILGVIVDPHTARPLETSTRAVGVDGERVSVDIALGYPADSWRAELAATVRTALEDDPAIESASVSVTSRIHAHQAQGKLLPLPGVKNILAVASGKGGVGKSTVAVNPALGVAAEGAPLGMLDADTYGPSQARMLGIEGRPGSPDGKTIIPMVGHGIQMMSIGLLVGDNTPMA